MDHLGSLPPLVLASASPRRSALLDLLRLTFVVDAADIDETPHAGEAPADYVARLAREKAEAVTARRSDAVVLAADTTVVLDGAILAKPADDGEARAMLRSLAGRTHDVLTGVAAVGGTRAAVAVARTRVTMRPFGEREVRWYRGVDPSLDKAGAYGIQGAGAFLVERIEGSHDNVIGLPLATLAGVVADVGHDLLAWSSPP